MGFGGVVMIMQPGIGIFSVFSVLPVMAALGYALSSTLVKLFPSRLSIRCNSVQITDFYSWFVINLLDVF